MLVPDDAASPTVTLVGGGAAQIVGRKHGALVLQASCKVSKVHCQIWMTANGSAYMSESSANGTWINGVRVQKDLAYSLETGDQISFPAPPGVTMPTLTFTAPGEQGAGESGAADDSPATHLAAEPADSSSMPAASSATPAASSTTPAASSPSAEVAHYQRRASSLVALLSGGPESEAAAQAAGALRKLARNNDAGKAAIIEADAIPPLVALLSGGSRSVAAKMAAGALDCLASGIHIAAVLEEVARTQGDCSPWDSLHAELGKCASERLQAATNEGTDAAALDHAITLARAVPLEKLVIDRAVELLREIYADTERQERRESFGLGSLAPPREFMCPITLDKMRGVPPPPHPRHSHCPLHRPRTRPCPRCVTDPVVASDGHSYERSAILSVINRGNGMSPLTRERLRPNVLIQNFNLKQRILNFEEDMLHAAAMAVANATCGAQQQGSEGPVASRVPAAGVTTRKRSRHDVPSGEPPSKPSLKRSRTI